MTAVSPQPLTRLRGLPRSLFSVPNPVRKNVTVAWWPIFSQRTGANKATQSKFAISFRRRKIWPSLCANQQSLLPDQTSHYLNDAQGAGLLFPLPPSRTRNAALDPD